MLIGLIECPHRQITPVILVINFQRRICDPTYALKILAILTEFKHCYKDHDVNRITVEIVRGERREFIE